MKRLILCLVLVIALAQFNFPVGQEVQLLEEQSPKNPRTSIDQNSIAMTDESSNVVVLSASFVDYDGEPLYSVDYSTSDTVYMQIVCVNNSTSSKTVKFEWDLRYADGASYYQYRTSKVVSGWTIYTYKLSVSNSYLSKLGTFSFTGRVYGTKIGNNNKVSSQLDVY